MSLGPVRYLGLAYLLGVVGDGALSMVAIAIPALEDASDAFSTAMIALSAIVLVLALIGRLKPRRVFIVPVLLYGVFTVVGVALGVAMMVKTRGRGLGDDFGLQDVVTLFPWFGPVNWALLALMMVIGIACLHRFLRTLTEDENVEAPAPSRGE